MAMLMTLPTALDAQLKRDAGLNSFEYHVLAALSDAPDHSLPAERARSDGAGHRCPGCPTPCPGWSATAGWSVGPAPTGAGPRRS